MSLTSYFLVHDRGRRAGDGQRRHWYLGHDARRAGVPARRVPRCSPAARRRTTFGDLRAAAAGPGPAHADAVFLLALVGFGSKAGIVPLHVWLPRAHPAAPSHVSALMSGVMIKLGVYGLLRVGLDLLGGGPAVVGRSRPDRLGAVSAVLGVLYALMEHDLKRLLAYSSVENVGIILIGLGAGFLFQSLGLAALAALGLRRPRSTTRSTTPCSRRCCSWARASVLHATGTRNMDRARRPDPRHALDRACFLVGAAAISALPPLNGFVSEWLALPVAAARRRRCRAPMVAVLMPLAVGHARADRRARRGRASSRRSGSRSWRFPRSRGSRARARGAACRCARGMASLAAACVGLGLAAVAGPARRWRGARGLGASPAPSCRLRRSGSPLPDAGRVRRACRRRCRRPRAASLIVGAARLRGPALGRAGRLRVSAHVGLRASRARRRAWSTPRPPSRSRSGGCSPSSTGRPQDLDDRLPSGVALLRAVHRVPRPASVPWFERYLYAAVLGFVAALGRPRRSALQSGSVPRLPRLRASPRSWSLLAGAGGHRRAVRASTATRWRWRQAARWRWRLAPGLVGLIRWLKARLQNRRGAPLWQPYFELRKLLAQGGRRLDQRVLALPRRAVRRVRQHAGGRRCSCRSSRCRCPSTRSATCSSSSTCSLLGTFFLALAGLDPGSPFGGMGVEPRDDGGRARRAHRGAGDLRAGAGAPAPPTSARSCARTIGEPAAALEPRPPARLRRALHRDARRDRPPARRQPGHASGADHDPRGDGARVLRAATWP